MAAAEKVKERPILFSGDMVRAILDGHKTQTRRLVKPEPQGFEPQSNGNGLWAWWRVENGRNAWEDRTCPYGVPGERLWVRETWADVNTENGPAIIYRSDGFMHFCVDDAYPVEYDRYPGCQFSMWWSDLLHREERKCKDDHKWRTSIHMPKWANRITIEVTGVRVELLQDITEEDAEAEGVDFIPSAPAALTHRTAFARLWDRIATNPELSWERNPWVWVIDFKKIDPRRN